MATTTEDLLKQALEQVQFLTEQVAYLIPPAVKFEKLT